mmetsp:Transcript_72997/g.225519  ORF Transcript_72997/g.225519 Transcript_72997/m.225519 type:complete len:200 (-) Transcript_72997:1274-1873(-)
MPRRQPSSPACRHPPPRPQPRRTALTHRRRERDPSRPLSAASPCLGGWGSGQRPLAGAAPGLSEAWERGAPCWGPRPARATWRAAEGEARASRAGRPGGWGCRRGRPCFPQGRRLPAWCRRRPDSPWRLRSRPGRPAPVARGRPAEGCSRWPGRSRGPARHLRGAELRRLRRWRWPGELRALRALRWAWGSGPRPGPEA